MKKLSLISVLCTVLVFHAKGDLKETFESWSTDGTTITLASGTWSGSNVSKKSNNGSNRAAMSSGSQLCTPAIDKPISVSFTHRASGSGKTLVVEKSTDGGVSWQQIGSVSPSSGSTYVSYTCSVGEAGTNDVYIRLTAASGTIYIDDFTVVCSNLVEEPATAPVISVVDVTGTSMQIAMTPGDGAQRLLVYRKGEAVTFVPEDGATYKNLPRNDDDNIIAYYGNDTSYTVTGLEAGETYYFACFEANGSDDGINYLTKSVAMCSGRTAEVPSITLSTTLLNMGNIKVGNSDKRIVKISARYLQPAVGEITISAQAPFALSLDNVVYSDTLTIAYTSHTLTDTGIYVRFTPTDYQVYEQEISISAQSAQTTLLLQGEGSDTDAHCYYISPSGDDVNDGTFDAPWYNLQVAVNAAQPGDTIFCFGGTYYPTYMQDGSKTTVRLTANGTADKRITIKNMPGESPIFDFKDQPRKVSVRGIQLDGNYWTIEGLHITRAGDNGIKLEGNHNIIRRCTFSYNDDTGLQLGFGHDFSDTHPGISSNDGTYCAYNDVIDCDSYLNCDSDNFGSDADGFACKMHNGKGNRFIRCRAWDNSDDAWDLYETDYAVYMYECWAWGSGRASNFDWVEASGSFQGNGNGIKLGGNGTGGSSKGIHECWNCVAFNNNKTGSVKGFDQNSHGDGNLVVNCLAFGNGYDFMFEKNGNNCTFYNNVCFGKIETSSGSVDSHNAMLSTTDNAWSNNVIRNFSTADYVSLTEDDAKAPRGDDGSLPTRFARLKSGSALIDAGKNGLRPDIWSETRYEFLVQPVYGAGRDLGPYELQEGDVSLNTQILLTHRHENALRCNESHISYSIAETGHTILRLYTLQGALYTTLFHARAESGVIYATPIPRELPAGIYIVQLLCPDGTRHQVKLLKK